MGYPVVVLCNNGMTKMYLVHRLVAEAFLPKLENRPCINHIDCNTANNVVSNLEWCTQKENVHHAWKLGRCNNIIEHSKILGKSSAKPVIQYDLQGNFIKKWGSMTEASRSLNIGTPHITQCCNKERRKAGNYIWRYEADKSNITPYKRKTRSKLVNQYDLNGNFIKQWDSLAQISEELKLLKTNISMCCNKKYAQAYGYKWEFVKER